MAGLKLREGLPFDKTCEFCALNGIVCVEKDGKRIAIHEDKQGLTVYNMSTSVDDCRGTRTVMVKRDELEEGSTHRQFMSHEHLNMVNRVASDLQGNKRKRI